MSVSETEAVPWTHQEYAAIYREHASAVRSLAVRVGTASLADEVTQEVFFRLWRRPGSFDPGRGSLRTFLLTMAHHMTVDRVRSQEACRARERSVAGQAPTDQVAPDDAATEGERSRAIGLALLELDDDHREPILMAYFGGLTYREVAVVLEVPEGTIKSRIRAGLGLLRASLNPELVA